MPEAEAEPKIGALLGVTGFEVSPDVINVSMLQGETKTERLRIKNIGKVRMSVKLSHDLNDLLFVPENELILDVDEEREIALVFTASEDKEPKAYTGRLIIEGGLRERTVGIIVNVEERKALFDVKVFIPDGYKEVRAGQEVESDIAIYNLGTLMPVDVEMYYSLRDMGGNDIIIKHETFAVGEQKLMKVRLDVPSETKKGYYLVYAKLVYKDSIATSSDIFEVVEFEMPAPFKDLRLYLVLIIIIVIGLIIIMKRKGGKKEEIYEIYRLIQDAHSHHKRKRVKKAKLAYLQAREKYVSLPKKHKKLIYYEMERLYDILKTKK